MIDARIAETFILPSRGKVYEEEVNPEVTLSSMTTKHEMLRLSAGEDNQRLMASIIDDCIENDMGISAYDLCLADYQFLMYKLRIVTFGNEYEMSSVCPYCGSRNNIKLDLDELPVKEYSDNILEYTEVELPRSESVVTLTLQTPRMLDKIDREVKAARKKMHNSENPYILYSMLNSIVMKDGEKFSDIEGEQWLREMPLGDANMIISAMEKLNTSFGMQLHVDHTCNVCGEEFIAPFRVNETFFRPSVF